MRHGLQTLVIFPSHDFSLGAHPRVGIGPGELAAMALALENPAHVVLLDDALARRVVQAAGLTVWGSLYCVYGLRLY